MRWPLFFLFTIIYVQPINAREYHVAKDGSDSNPGTEDKPFATISRAVKDAKSNDEVIIHAGVYREQVLLRKGGKSDEKRLIIRSAANAHVAIKGSEHIKSWQKADQLWKVTLENSFFPDVNPFKALVRYPKTVSVDKEYNGTGWQTYGLEIHRGNVFIEDRPLKEVSSIEELKTTSFSWHAKVDANSTQIWLNAGDIDPNKQRTEILVREKIIAAKHSNVNFVTIKGLTLHHAATHWAPPTVYQPGAIEPNGGRRWIIENNDIGFSRAVCVSIGIPQNTTRGPFRSSQHTIRHNHIKGCGQAGIAGQYYGDKSIIAHNIIEDINIHREFGGWETAGIKVHHNDYSIIENNLIRGVYTADPQIGAAHGIWIDYQNTHIVIRNNIILEADGNAILLEANWNGPILVANNIMVGRGSQEIATFSSRRGIWVHNLFVDTKPIWKNQSYDSRPSVKGDRWFNNIFIGDTGLDNLNTSKMKDFAVGNNLHLDDSTASQSSQNSKSSDTPTNFKIDLVRKKNKLIQVKVHFELGKTAIAENLPKIDRALHKHKIKTTGKKDVPVDFDILGQRRSTHPQWGPFENIKPGHNDFVIKL